VYKSLNLLKGQVMKTHIEVLDVKGGSLLGIETGDLLNVVKETPCFFFVKTHSGRSLKVSKRTRRLCYWRAVQSSPIFNL
jgi:hypothetical protein